MKQKPTRLFSRAAMTLLLSVLTTMTAWADDVTYINANGQSAIAEEVFPLSGGEPSLNTGWYYVGNDITYDGTIDCHGDVHIILADGKTMTINSGGNGIDVHGSLTIYGQTNGTGTLNATGDDQGIYSPMGSITICGGTVNVTSKNDGIYTNSGDITISGGRVTATSEYATGISTDFGNITLGCTTASDFIYASSYGVGGHHGKLKIADGQTLYDEYDNLYSGDDILIPDGVTLCSFFPHVIAQYIDAAGKPARCAAIALDGTESTLGEYEQETWYYVGNDFSHSGTIYFRGDVNIILADGKTMTTINSNTHGIYVNGSLTIYGQAKGTGTLNATSEYGKGISTDSGTITICGGTVNATSGFVGIYTESGDITICGGRVTATGENYVGIYTESGDITISGGRVTVTGDNEGIHSGGGTITISGGRVTVTGEGGAGIYTNSGNITLGCTTASDFIYASSNFAGQHGKLKIADGQTLYDEDGNTYSGDDITIPDGVTLCSFPHVIAQYIDANGKPARCPAIALGGTETTLGLDGQEMWYYVGNDITYNRTINCLGDVNIILADGKTLTITSSDDNGIDVNGSLTIYGQELGTGTLNVTGFNGINPESGNITICGGTVNATGDNNGISTGSGNITICGGTVNATGDNAGIFTFSGDITISGGTVDAKGISTGSGNITICGGTVTAKGISSFEGSITISGGNVDATSEGIYSNSGTITISGGTVTATSDYGNGIHSDSGSITISGGTVDATGDDYGNGISSFEGSITISGGTITAKGIHSADGDITISGGNVDATGDGIHSDSGDITISGGTVTAKGEDGDGIHSDSGDITISGGTVTVTGDNEGIHSRGGTITLGYTTDTDFIKVSSYNVLGEATLKIADDQTLYDEYGTEYSGTLSYGTIPAGATLRPLKNVLALYDSEDNSEAINGSNKKSRNVILYDRTLYKDGEWNTLCLPFDVTITGSVLDGADVRALDTNATGYDHATGLDGNTLYLNFTAEGAVKKIEAGVPYIIKWPATEPDYIENPVFKDVKVEYVMNNVPFTGGTFRGTYAKQEYTEENKSILLLGTENSLYWPQPDGNTKPSIGAFRAYFELGGGQEARQFVLNFAESETTSLLNEELRMKNEEFATAAEWFTLDGRKLSDKPTKKGVYIHEGRKVVIK